MARHGENIRKRKDGRWEGRYINGYSSCGKAKYSSIYGKTYLEVKNKMIEAKGNTIHNNASCCYTNSYFREVLLNWLSAKEICVKPSTYVKYSNIVHHHIIPVIGGIKVKKLTDDIVRIYLIEQANFGALGGDGHLS